MKYYAIQVKTRSEETFIGQFQKAHPYDVLSLHFPRRELFIRRQGAVSKSRAAVFPGYVFIESGDDEEMPRYLWKFRHTEDFYRFLPSNRNIRPLANRDLELALHFIKKAGPVAGVSRVCFNEQSRIVVLEGPLMGLEGNIIKVDKRKQRAKIKLDLCSDSFCVDLAFEVIASAAR
jgi:transcriptional antiterminator NusG